MKVILTSLILLATAAAQANGKAGDVFFVKGIKTQICKEASNKFRKLNLRVHACEDAKFYFAKDKVSLKISGTKKPLTTLMEVTFETMGVEFEAGVKAILEVAKSGKIERTGWTLSYVNPKEFSDKALLAASWLNDDNVIQMTLEEHPGKSLLRKMKKAMESDLLESLNNGAELTGNDVGDDVELASMDDGHKILNLKTGKVLGYLFSGDAASERGDIKIFTTFKFNLEGDIIDYSEWSGGYHE